MIIPEIIIQRVLVNGIRKVRNIPWKSDQLFKSVPQSFAQQFYELISNTPIDITINYPREDSQFPCIAILLRAEEETDMFLGDLLSAGYDSTDSLFGSEDFFYTKNEGTSAETYGLTDLLGSGNKFEDTPKIFDKSVQTYKEIRGSGQSCSYLLQVMTDDQDFTIFLYHMIRYIILSGIPTFTDNGMHQMRLSGTDFLPQASQQPNFIFMRGINMNFLYFADYFLKEGDPDLEAVAKAFIISIGDSRKGGFSTLAAVQKLNVTSITPATMVAGTRVSWTYYSDNTVNTSGISVAGINFQTGISIEFIKTNPDIPDDSPFVDLGTKLYTAVGGTRTTLTVSEASGFSKFIGARVTLLTQGINPSSTGLNVGCTAVLAYVNSSEDPIATILTCTNFLDANGNSISQFPDPVSNLDTFSLSYFSVTNSRFINVDTVTVLDEGLTGTAGSTPLVVTYTGTVPSDLSEGMFLQVVGPTTHAGYREQRRIISFTSGSGGTITVATKFSGSLNGAIIKVVKESSTLLFDLAVSSNTPTGVWDVRFTNPDLIFSTLTNSFTVT